MITLPIDNDTGWIQLRDDSRYRKKNGIVYIVFSRFRRVKMDNIFILSSNFAP